MFGNPLAQRENLSSTFKSSPEGRYLLLKMVVMVVVLAGLALVVVCCQVDEFCGVDGWQGPKNPFRPPINHPLEGELLCFKGKLIASEGAIFGQGRNSGGTRNNLFLFLSSSVTLSSLCCFHCPDLQVVVAVEVVVEAAGYPWP